MSWYNVTHQMPPFGRKLLTKIHGVPGTVRILIFTGGIWVDDSGIPVKDQPTHWSPIFN